MFAVIEFDEYGVANFCSTTSTYLQAVDKFTSMIFLKETSFSLETYLNILKQKGIVKVGDSFFSIVETE